MNSRLMMTSSAAGDLADARESTMDIATIRGKLKIHSWGYQL
jgi:hypothetical protein